MPAIVYHHPRGVYSSFVSLDSSTIQPFDTGSSALSRIMQRISSRKLEKEVLAIAFMESRQFPRDCRGEQSLHLSSFLKYAAFRARSQRMTGTRDRKGLRSRFSLIRQTCCGQVLSICSLGTSPNYHIAEDLHGRPERLYDRAAANRLPLPELVAKKGLIKGAIPMLA